MPTRHSRSDSVEAGKRGHSLHLTLHPQHCQTFGGPRPLTGPSPAPGRAQRLRELDRLAERALQHREGDEHPGASGCEVFRACGNLVIRSADCKHVCVPFLLAEVGYAQQESESIVAFGRYSELPTDRSHEYESWLIVVPGGKMALQSFLYVLSKGGVVRGDVEKECSMVKKPFAFGASSSIYRVQRLVQTEDGKNSLGQEMAAKCLSAQSASDVLKVDQEVKMLLKAQGHPNIIRFRGIFFCSPQGADGPEDEAPTNRLAQKAILLTDYYMRGCIWKCIRRDGALTEGEALGLSAGVLSALAHIHAMDIIHRDVKSENILRGRDGRAVLTDFGIACSVRDAKEMQRRCGTPGYAAPEILSDGSPYGEKVDVFGAGVVLYFTVYACMPFGPHDGSQSQILRKTNECNITFPGDLAEAPQVRSVILMFLEKDPDVRPASKLALQIIGLISHAKPCFAAAPSGMPASSSASSMVLSDSPKKPEESGKPTMRPQPPTTSQGPRRKIPGLSRRVSLLPQQQEAPQPRLLSPSDSGTEDVAWRSEGWTPRSGAEESSACRAASPRPLPSSSSWSSRGAAAAWSHSRSNSPRNTASSSVVAASPSTSFIPSMDRICPSFMRRRSKASTGVDPPAHGA